MNVGNLNPVPYKASVSPSGENVAEYAGPSPMTNKFENMLSQFQGKASSKTADAKQARATIEEAAEQMETMFATFMLKTMDQYGTENGLLGKTPQGFGYFKDMFYQNMAEQIADSGNLGFKEALKNTYGIK